MGLRPGTYPLLHEQLPFEGPVVKTRVPVATQVRHSGGTVAVQVEHCGAHSIQGVVGAVACSYLSLHAQVPPVTGSTDLVLVALQEIHRETKSPTQLVQVIWQGEHEVVTISCG